MATRSIPASNSGYKAERMRWHGKPQAASSRTQPTALLLRGTSLPSMRIHPPDDYRNSG
jgi:hypothetical protein